jgi:DNA repair protein RadC
MTSPASDRHFELINVLTTRGPVHLSDFDLLTLAFGGLVPVNEAADRALEYTKELGPPATMQCLDFLELTFFKGIGDVKAAALVAAVELGRRAGKQASRNIGQHPISN